MTDKVGNARVTMKGNPETLTRADPQLHYMLRLCQAQTNPSQATEWLKKLAGLHDNHPTERDKLHEREVDALCDLAIVIGFIQDLSSTISIPSVSGKKGQMFGSKLQALEAELNQLKNQVDLRDFATPIDHLLEPEMSEKALKSLDDFVVQQAGTQMGFLYQDLVEECLLDLQNQYQQATDNTSQRNQVEQPSFPIPVPQSPASRVEGRKQKNKTRPPHSATYEILPRLDTLSIEEPLPPSQTLKVRSSTAEIFSSLFTKSQSRSPVSWEGFQAAMTDVGFSTLPKYGSVYTFFPLNHMMAKKPLTVHRPHKSRIEGYMSLIFARRLNRLYGWDEGTFEVA